MRTATARSWRETVTPRPPGRRYWEERLAHYLGGSIGDGSAVLVPAGATFENEPLQVRQRLGDGEATGTRLQVVSEERERDRVAGRGSGPSAASVTSSRSRVVRDQRVSATDTDPRSARRGPAARVVAPARSSARSAREVVAERVGAALGPEADGRRDRVEQVVGCDENAVTQQAQLPVGVAGGGNDCPAVASRLPASMWIGFFVEADVRPVEGALADQLVRDVAGDAAAGGTSR